MKTEEFLATFEHPMRDWFELSYSSYLVVPRSLLCDMPIEWQRQMVSLLNEMRRVYDTDKIENRYTVKLRGEDGRFKKDPLADYRHPPELPYRSINEEKA